MTMKRSILLEEREIHDFYIHDVAENPGIVNLDKKDYEVFSSRYRPLLLVAVDGDSTLTELLETALKEAERHVAEMAGVIVSMSYKPGCDILMEELSGMSDVFGKLSENDTEIVWGMKQSTDIENNRSVALFVFGQ